MKKIYPFVQLLLIVLYFGHGMYWGVWWTFWLVIAPTIAIFIVHAVEFIIMVMKNG